MKDICSICNKLKVIHKRENQNPICYICEKITKNTICSKYYSKLSPPKLKLCTICNEIEIISKNNICRRCYNKTYKPPLNKCFICNEIKPTHKRDENNNSICKKCYNSNYVRPLFNCFICKELKPIYKRDKQNNPLCKKCGKLFYKAPLVECSICNKIKNVAKRDENNKPICHNCYKCSLEKCFMCGNIKEVYKRDNKNPICKKCWVKIRRKNDESFRIKCLLRSRLRNIKNHNFKKYGIDYKEIIDYLGKCPGEDYHIDHIFPLCAFDFSNPIHIKAAFAPENHQWLKKEDNLIKGGKYNKEEFEKYLRKYEEQKND